MLTILSDYSIKRYKFCLTISTDIMNWVYFNSNSICVCVCVCVCMHGACVCIQVRLYVCIPVCVCCVCKLISVDVSTVATSSVQLYQKVVNVPQCKNRNLTNNLIHPRLNKWQRDWYHSMQTGFTNHAIRQFQPNIAMLCISWHHIRQMIIYSGVVDINPCFNFKRI